MDDNVTDYTGLKCDPRDYSRYNKVAILCFGCHHEHSGNHREGEIQKASPKCLGEPQGAKTESQWMNDVVTKQNVIKGWDDRTNEDLFADVVKLCAKFNKSENHKDLIHVGQVGSWHQ